MKKVYAVWDNNKLIALFFDYFKTLEYINKVQNGAIIRTYTDYDD